MIKLLPVDSCGCWPSTSYNVLAVTIYVKYVDMDHMVVGP